MILTAFHGFCMALADSIPGVSGGTIAFILGFYERFLAALNALFGADRAARGPALRYLCKLGVGWCVGLLLSILLISRLLEQHIYLLSSIFLGLTAASIPFILRTERATLRRHGRSAAFTLLGAAAVVALTALRQSPLVSSAVNYLSLSPADFVYLFFTGMLAIGAMVLPGISGSSVLMIFGTYVPTLRAVTHLFELQLGVLPGLCVLLLGFIVGAAVFARFIRRAMRAHRPQMICLILGLMLGSLYAISLGPTTMEVPVAPVTPATFRLPGFLLGVAVLLILEQLRRLTEKRQRQARMPSPAKVSRTDQKD